jgi:hypothetical protein
MGYRLLFGNLVLNITLLKLLCHFIISDFVNKQRHIEI